MKLNDIHVVQFYVILKSTKPAYTLAIGICIHYDMAPQGEYNKQLHNIRKYSTQYMPVMYFIGGLYFSIL